MRHVVAFSSFFLSLAPLIAAAIVPVPKCPEPVPLFGHFNPAKPLIGIHLKVALKNPEASLRRIVKAYGLKLDENEIRSIIDNRFFSNYFIYEKPSPELVAALRCDPDVSAVDYDGMLR